ncbi:phosphoglycerate dehydrogenase [Youngiibacter fragilis]|uniref:D-3-phosphoglycerate dehydrogenase n=1 Tax=Youngiibacter fragilis 232.1 TaxID=994573 RepID=V7I3Q9_9CLOT|nr:phosphoglycerate dehydrogenase [Youngiibacter fragilis]ETA80508.1 3-phosphoglycerate dehydrogenase [Youngiibacter fragilis 232.1]
MYAIKTLNNISDKGMKLFTSEYDLSGEGKADGILLRSYSMHGMELDDSVKVIARAGAGVNNIPTEEYAEKGIVVCNTPGANANAVKELVLLGLLMSSRNVVDAVDWVRSIKDNPDAEKVVEKEKGRFTGQELTGKKIGIIGLGAIGALVANMCTSLKMDVYGYDPFISVSAAWGLSYKVKRVENVDMILNNCDYVSLHVPLIEQTKNIITADRLKNAKKGLILLNFARGGLVPEAAIKEALELGSVSTYVTDFPNNNLLNMKNVICIPHLGASTEESEENCAIMAVNATMEFLENGNIVNSVNYPECCMGPADKRDRISICNRNIPNMVGQISGILAEKGMNIAEMKNQSKGNYAYTLIDTDNDVDEDTLDRLKSIEGVIRVRLIKARNKVS